MLLTHAAPKDSITKHREWARQWSVAQHSYLMKTYRTSFFVCEHVRTVFARASAQSERIALTRGCRSDKR